MAYLLDKSRTKVLFVNDYHQLRNTEVLRRMTPQSITPGGSSFSFSLDPEANRSLPGLAWRRLRSALGLG